jgi:hypothetical protein
MKKYLGAAILTLVLACCGTTALWAQVTGGAGGAGGPGNEDIHPASRHHRPPVYYDYYGNGIGSYRPPPSVYYDYYGYYGPGRGPINGAVQPGAKYPSPGGGWAGN